jgi:hypothetical protein
MVRPPFAGGVMVSDASVRLTVLPVTVAAISAGLAASAGNLTAIPAMVWLLLKITTTHNFGIMI